MTNSPALPGSPLTTASCAPFGKTGGAGPHVRAVDALASDFGCSAVCAERTEALRISTVASEAGWFIHSPITLRASRARLFNVVIRAGAAGEGVGRSAAPRLRVGVRSSCVGKAGSISRALRFAHARAHRVVAAPASVFIT